MKTQSDTLCFVLSKLQESVTKEELLSLLTSISERMPSDCQLFYDTIAIPNGFVSFEYEHDLAELVKAGNIAVNGKVEIQKASEIKNRAFRLNFEIQKQIKETLGRVLSKDGKSKDWKEAVPNSCAGESPTGLLFTAGYEGTNLDSFLNKLIKAGVCALVDVRRNPISRKYGFSKKILAKACGIVGIQYRHMPEFGIEGELRKDLASFEDYQDLFSRYESKVLIVMQKELVQLGKILNEQPSVLVCFEADSNFCHRKTLAKAVSLYSDLRVVHL